MVKMPPSVVPYCRAIFGDILANFFNIEAFFRFT
jgi:hypothetical protein